MATSTTEKSVHTLIIDTGPLIKNTVSISTILQQAEEIYTTSAVLSEIRDPATRARVETTLLPFLKVRNPSTASYEAVTAFSKKTGDFPVLSRQDLGILALAYEIHCEKHGGDVGLRRAPGGEIVKGMEEEKVDAQTEDANREDAPKDPESKDVDSTSNKPTEPDTATETASEHVQPLEEDLSNLQISQPILPEVTEQATLEASQPAPQETSELAAEDVSRAISQEGSQYAPQDVSQSNPQEDSPSTSSEDDSDGEWITPSNLSQHLAKDSGVSSRTTSSTQTGIATMTTDFAMQNVLLQMNLHLLSTNLQRISTLRTYILRCHACFLTTKEVTKQFCPRCGQPTLNRVSCTTSASGEFKIHLSKTFQHNNRGNRYSVPKPVGGTPSGKMSGKGGGKGGWGRELVLAEDQKEYLKHAEQEKRIKTRDLMDEDYLPGILTGDRGRSGGRMKVGAGKNVNSRKKF
ncbi:hypothetical protein K505DRAFT_320506 [Melanomma pulvis-pyrius CBS 109.77]|uniref:20S-pre-rRNA D-site endonuclease NOB1 n=1 Tax=Melanomma pulvis-pyrius CBS 109.77 TaxID=1314802 RepID=A0A6A6XV12_9PLEO|nr:hypothetical protein K505DRAFT_320506 [Melanomma pulvis-pyrius CBS 109.77]